MDVKQHFVVVHELLRNLGLIDFTDRINLLEIISLEEELSRNLGIQVDLVTVNSIDWMCYVWTPSHISKPTAASR